VVELFVANEVVGGSNPLTRSKICIGAEMILTREIINKNIKFVDFYNDEDFATHYDYAELDALINAYKNLLMHKYHVTPGNTVLIGESSSIRQTAMMFACLELGMTLVIVDYNRSDQFETKRVDTKTLLLLPIDIFVIGKLFDVGKFQFFSKISEKTISLGEETELDYTENHIVHAVPTSVAMKCTSSGTTGTPKVITHTHEFLYELSLRNSNMFSGTVAQGFNLNHGSSLATYYLPTLMSGRVNQYINFTMWLLESVIDRIMSRGIDLDHLMLPYAHLFDVFLSGYCKYPQKGICLYTLNYIKDEWKQHVLSGKISDVVSIFGSNETSGPTLINRLTDKNFHTQEYRPIDDFYQLDLVNNELVVKMPVYENTVIHTKDLFELSNGKYRHLGRDDLYRINGIAFNENKYQRILAEYTEDAKLIFDFVRNEIYLCFFEKLDLAEMKNIAVAMRKRLRDISNNTHSIDKYGLVNPKYFMSGIKLDHELIRDHFRYRAGKF
jgi:hypothetical protein